MTFFSAHILTFHLAPQFMHGEDDLVERKITPGHLLNVALNATCEIAEGSGVVHCLLRAPTREGCNPMVMR